MDKLVAFLVYSVITIIQVFTCSLFIESAVKRFKKEEYFMFGVNLVISIWLISGILAVDMSMFY